MTTEQRLRELRDSARAALETVEYKKFHAQVVEEGVRRTGEDWRKSWEELSCEAEFLEGDTVDDVVTAEIESNL